MFSTNYILEALAYISLLLLFFIIIRFLAIYITNIIAPPQSTQDDQDQSVDPFHNDVYYAVSYWTEKGGRPYQEDRHCELKGIGKDDSSLYGVFDGHGGSRASQFCKEFLLQNTLNEPGFVQEPSNALKIAFNKTDIDFAKSTGTTKVATDGTTAIVAVIHGRRLFVANAGDSRCIIVQRGGKIKPMSYDHKPNREDEEKRIVQLGGKVVHWGRWRVQGVLAVSRAIGDISLKPYVTCEPEIMEKDIGVDDEYLVLASDGLWDVLRNEDVGKLVYSSANRDFLGAARHLCSEALIMGSTDNITVMIVDLRNRFPRPQSSSQGGLNLGFNYSNRSNRESECSKQPTPRLSEKMNNFSNNDNANVNSNSSCNNSSSNSNSSNGQNIYVDNDSGLKQS